MEKNSKMDSSEKHVTAILNEDVETDNINEELDDAVDKLYKTICLNICFTSLKLSYYIDKFEGMMTDYDGDTACITINNNNFTDTDQFYIGGYTKDVIDVINNQIKSKYELIGIELFDDVTIVKVKV